MRRLLLLCLLLTPLIGKGQIPDAAISAFSASYAAEKAGDYAKAIETIQSVHRDDFYESNLRMGWLHYNKKEYTASVRYYRQAIKLRPASIEGLMGFVNPAAALQLWADVFSAYQSVLRLDPSHSLANYRIALMYYYRKEWAAASKHLQTVIEHYPFDYDSILLMAQVKLAEGKVVESKRFYERALLYNPSNDAIKKVLEKL